MSTFQISKSERLALQSQSRTFQTVCSLPVKSQSAQSLAVPVGSAGQVGGIQTHGIESFEYFCESNALDTDSAIARLFYDRYRLSCAASAHSVPHHIAVYLLSSPSGNWRSRCHNRSLHHPDFVFGEPLWGCINTRKDRLS